MRAAAIVVVFLFAAQSYATESRALLLELWVNGRSTHKILHVEARNGGYFLRGKDLREAGLAVGETGGAEGYVRVDALKDVSVSLDQAGQRLLVSAAPSVLKPQVFDLRPSDLSGETAQSAAGVRFDYDLSASFNDARHVWTTGSAAGQGTLSIFTSGALFTANGFLDTGPAGNHTARLDTALEFDDGAHVRRVTIGDAILGSLDWSRPIRFGGIQFASDFSLRPDLVTMPLPQFFGMAAVPSTVDVYSGAVRLFETDINPGPFELNNLPVVTGGGTATVVVRDVLGRQSTQTVSFYATNRLLAPGLSSYDIDAGFLRRNYGLDSFSYGAPILAFTVQHGLNAGLTAETHGEATPKGALAGGGLAFGLGDFGAMSADLAASRSVMGTGFLGSLGMEGWIAPLKIYGAISGATGRYADLAALDDDPVPALRFQLGAALSLEPFASVAASWSGERRRGDASTDIVSASYSLSGGNGLYFGLTGLRDIGARVWAAQVFISVPVGGGFASSNADYSDHRASAQAAYTMPADPDGGLGWRAMALDNGSIRRLEGEATFIGDTGTYDGALDASDGGLAARAGASGSLVLLGGKIFAARSTDGALALVETGAEGVRIYRENRLVAVSNADGEALLTGLAPFAPNHIAVDPRDYPMAIAVARSESTVIPRRRSGVIVDLAPDSRGAFMARFVVSDGSVPPVGARVDVNSLSVPLIVGRNGEVYLVGLNIPSSGAITFGRSRCTFTISFAASGASLPRTHEVVCNLDDDHEH